MFVVRKSYEKRTFRTATVKNSTKSENCHEVKTVTIEGKKLQVCATSAASVNAVRDTLVP